MRDGFIEVRFHKLLLVLTKDEYLRALRRGQTVRRNRSTARELRRVEESTGSECCDFQTQ